MAADLDMPLLSSLPQYGTSIQDSLISSANLTKSGTWENGRLYQRRNSVRHTCASDCSLLPTPTTYAESLRPGVRPVGTNKLERRLRQYPNLLPTPTANNGFTSRSPGCDRNRRLTGQLKILPSESASPAVWGWMMGFPELYVEAVLMRQFEISVATIRMLWLLKKLRFPDGCRIVFILGSGWLFPRLYLRESQARESQAEEPVSTSTAGVSPRNRPASPSDESSTLIPCCELEVGDRLIFHCIPILGEVVEIDLTRTDPYRIEYCNRTEQWHSIDRIRAGTAHSLAQVVGSDPEFVGIYRRVDDEPRIGDCLCFFATAVSWGIVIGVSSKRKNPYKIRYCGGQIQCHKPAELGIGQGMDIYRQLDLSTEGGFQL